MSDSVSPLFSLTPLSFPANDAEIVQQQHRIRINDSVQILTYNGMYETIQVRGLSFMQYIIFLLHFHSP